MSRRYLELTKDDRMHLAQLAGEARPYLDRIVTELAEMLHDAEEVQGFLGPESLTPQLRSGLEAYLTAMASGGTDSYLARMGESVRASAERDVPFQALVVAVMAFEGVIAHLFAEVLTGDLEHPALRSSFLKFNQLCLIAAADGYLLGKEETIRDQQSTLQALSTPVVEVWPGILALPLVGTIDTARAKQITQNLLRRIRETQARVTILDITGVPLVDTRIANHLIKTIRAARLLGARGILAGISPEIADTLISLDVDFAGIDTYFSLRQALEAAINFLGLTIVQREVIR